MSVAIQILFSSLPLLSSLMRMVQEMLWKVQCLVFTLLGSCFQKLRLHLSTQYFCQGVALLKLAKMQSCGTTRWVGLLLRREGHSIWGYLFLTQLRKQKLNPRH